MPKDQRVQPRRDRRSKKSDLTDDERAWLRVSHALHKSIGECKQAMTRRERRMWIKYLNEQATEKRERWEWYAARISYYLYVILGVFRKQPTKKESEFLIEYRIDRPLTPAEQRIRDLEDKKERDAHVAKVRLYWSMVRLSAGLNTKKKDKEDGKPRPVVIPAGVKVGKKKPPAHFVIQGKTG